jgi:hypothetical protein
MYVKNKGRYKGYFVGGVVGPGNDRFENDSNGV